MNIIRDNPAMAKSMGLIKVDEEPAKDPPVADLPELKTGSTGDPKLDQGLREAAALIARAEKADVPEEDAEKKKKPPFPPKDGDKEELDDDDAGKSVKFADPGYQEDGKERFPLDTEAMIRSAWIYFGKASSATKYSAARSATIKRRIVRAWKSTIDPEGPPIAVAAAADGKGKIKENSMQSPALAKLGKPDASLSTKKGIETVISALSLLKQIKRIKDCLVLEKDKEGDDSDQATRWAAVLESIGTLVQDLAKEEIGELMVGPDIDCLWGSSPYDMMWAAKALKPAILTMGKSDFVEMFDELLGDDTAAANYLKLAEFTDAIGKAQGTLSIEEWSNPGEGTAYGPHSDKPNDTWAKGDTAQKVHDAMVEMGAKCTAAAAGETQKEHSDIPGATGPGDPKDPPKDIRDGTGGHSDIPGATGPGNPKDPPKNLAAEAISEKLNAVLIERMLETNERLLDVVERAAMNGGAAKEQRDPPQPRKGTLFTVDKADDFTPAPGSDGKGRTTGDTTKAADPMDTLKAIHESPRFLSRGN